MTTLEQICQTEAAAQAARQAGRAQEARDLDARAASLWARRRRERAAEGAGVLCRYCDTLLPPDRESIAAHVARAHGRRSGAQRRRRAA